MHVTGHGNFSRKTKNPNPERKTAMKNCTASAASFASIALCALLGFSLVAFAARGPCVWLGDIGVEDDTPIYDSQGNQIGGVHVWTWTDKGDECKNLNEDSCNTGPDYERLKTHVVTKTFYGTPGNWKLFSTVESFTQGVEACGLGR